MTNLNLTIQGDSSVLTMTDGRTGTKHCKPIDLSEFVNVLSAHTAHDFGLLPAGCRYLVQHGPNTYIALEVPSAKYDISYNRSTINGVYMPAALFLFMLNRSSDGAFQIVKSEIFAMKNDHVMLSTDGLYHYPAPNIYPDHRICWGQNNDIVKGLRSLSALGGVARRFFSAPFNTDLFGVSQLGTEFPWKDIDKGDLPGGFFRYLTTNEFSKTWLRQGIDTKNSFTKAIKTIQGV